jgi:hypothetical protein
VKCVHALAVLVLLCVGVAAADAQTVTLRYRWTKGESRSYRVTTQTDSTITGMPSQTGAPSGPVTTSQTVTQVFKYTADDVAADGSVTLRQTFQSVRMESTSPMGKAVVDSTVADLGTDPATRGMRNVLTAMVGESVVIAMAPDGTVRSIDGGTTLAAKIAKVADGNPAALPAVQAVRGQLSEEALRTTIEQTFPKLSGPPVKTGDTWTGQLAMGNPAIGRITGRSTFTLRPAEGAADASVARIAIVLVLRQDVVPPPSGPAGMVMTLGAAKGEGEILFDVSKGQIQRSTMRSDMPSTATMTGPDGGVLTMENKTTIVMTMSLVEK